MNIFPCCFDLSCELMIMIAMLKAHSISLYWTPRSTRVHIAKSTQMSKKCSKTEYSCCTVQSCWTQRLVQRDAMRFQHCNHHHRLKAQVKTTGKYIHTCEKLMRCFFLLQRKCLKNVLKLPYLVIVYINRSRYCELILVTAWKTTLVCLSPIWRFAMGLFWLDWKIFW